MPKCAVCGGTEFAEDGGFYYCTECQTICNDVINQVVDDAGGTMLSYTTKIASRESHHEYKWTTWEAYNFILKGMVDEVIGMGASPEIKFVVLQLWARYLQELQVAFFKNRNKRPKLGPGYSSRDAKVVYSISEGNKLVKKRSGSVHSFDSSILSKKRAGSKAKKALAKAQYEQSINSSCDGSSVSKGFTRRSYMSKDAISVENLLNKKQSKIKRYPWMSNTIRYTDNIKKISRTKLLVILHLGLRLCNDGIHLSDLLRWIREGHLSYHNVAHFFPSNFVLKGKDGHLFKYVAWVPSHERIRKIGMDMAKMLCIDDIPGPHWPDLIHRYTKDLELPEDLANFAIKLLAECPPTLKFKVGLKYKLFLPNYEGYAMAFIIFAMKLLFGLDGLSEIKLSEFASKTNKILHLGEDAISRNSDCPVNQLFVWEDWVKYIEFRKSLLTRFHPAMAATDESENMNLLRNKNDTIPPLPPHLGFFPYLEHLKKHSDKSSLHHISRKGNDWAKFMTKHLEEMITEMVSIENDFHIHFKPSLTPLSSYMEELQGHRLLREIWSKEMEGICKLFDASFIYSSLEYLFHKERCIEALKNMGVSVNIIKSSAFCESEAKHIKFVEPIQVPWDKVRKNFVSVRLTEDRAIQKGEIPLIAWNKKLKMIKELVDDDVGLNGRKNPNNETNRKVNKIKPSINSEEMTDAELTLFLPYRKLWMSFSSSNKVTDVTFSDMRSKFPCSFSWLLQLCAALLEMDDATLFFELMNIELLHKARKIRKNQESGSLHKNMHTNTTKIERLKAYKVRRNW